MRVGSQPLTKEIAMLKAQSDLKNRRDNEVAADVEQALWDDEVVRAIDYPTIAVSVRAGTVTLGGFAANLVTRARAEHAARTVPGVLELNDQLVTDTDLATLVAGALGRDARLQHEMVQVAAYHGVIVLTGAVSSAVVRSAAEECASGISQVRWVINRIEAPGVKLDAADQRVLQPYIGQEVFATDMSLGLVERVIINPHNRHIIACVVSGEFPDPERSDALLLDWSMCKRSVVIPMTAVRHITVGGVFLSITGCEATRCGDFDPAAFAVPDIDWRPPYPYNPADVLLDEAQRKPARPVATEETVSGTRLNG